jgi:DNA-binding transcriptional MerR regulator
MKPIDRNTGQAVQLFETVPRTVYSIEALGQLAGVPRREILIYCRHHLLSPVADPQYEGYYFNDEAIRTLRHIEYLHNACSVSLEGIKMIFHLMNEVEWLRSELRFLRQ